MEIYIILEHLLEKGFSHIVYAGSTPEKVVKFLEKNLETEGISIYDFNREALIKDLDSYEAGNPVIIDGKDVITVHRVVVE